MAGGLSYRLRRRLRLLGIFCVLAGGVASAIVLLPKGHKLRQPKVVAAPQPAASPAAPRQHVVHRVSAVDRSAMIQTISLFVTTSVARHHPERSWEIVDPKLRQGMTKRQWATGNIPVVPYPAASVDLVRLEGVVGGTAQVEVFLEPARGTQEVRKTFQIDLGRIPGTPHGWAVQSWVPEGVSESRIQRDADRRATPAELKAATNPTRLSMKWIAVPAGVIVGGLLLVPIFLLGRDSFAGWRARRRAALRR